MSDDKLFKGECPHCDYVVTADTFARACEELIAHIKEKHIKELHEIYEHALNRAVIQGISCVE